MSPAPYYSDEWVTLYHGDCREVTEWLAADVLVTDPPYGRGWSSGGGLSNSLGRGHSKPHDGIANDKDPSARDGALAVWGERLAIVFGDPLVGCPVGTVQALVYAKPPDAGVRGARAGFRRDVEMVYLVGSWPCGIGGRSSILTTRRLLGGPKGLAASTGHPHVKPLDVLGELLEHCPPGTVADPFAGSGSTLVAAKRLGRKAIGVELDERYCEIAAKRLAQGVLDFGQAPPEDLAEMWRVASEKVDAILNMTADDVRKLEEQARALSRRPAN